MGLVGAFIVASFIIELTPGPNMAYLAMLSIERGRAAGLWAVAGVASGLALLGAIAGIGAGSLIAQNSIAYEAVRWAGVAYLLWLAFDTWRTARRPLAAGEAGDSARHSYLRGLLTNLLNPKALLFFVSVLPEFVGPGDAVAQTSVLTVVYVLVATGVHLAIVLAATILGPVLFHSGSRRALGMVFAALLVGVAIWVAMSTHRA